MKQRILVCILALSLLLVFTGCFCQHEVWNDANCVNPKTCAECGETEGAPLGHSWIAATCTDPKTCETCKATEGEAKGHAWVDATCTDPKTCTACKLTEGEALGHAWVDATTDAPKTCTTCNLTEGERIITDERFTTSANSFLFGKWTGVAKMDGTVMGIEDFDGSFEVNVTLTFGSAGELDIALAVKDVEAFNTAMLKYLEDSLYASFASEGYKKDAADSAMKATYGMTVSEYAASMLTSMDLPGMLAANSIAGVYYVQDGKIYTGDAWTSTLEASDFKLEGDSLTISEFVVGEDSVVLTRVAE